MRGSTWLFNETLRRAMVASVEWFIADFIERRVAQDADVRKAITRKALALVNRKAGQSKRRAIERGKR